MKKLIFIHLILFSAIFCSCFGKSMKYEMPSDETAVNKVMARNSAALAKKYRMRPFAVTVAMPEGDIQYLELKFQIYGPLSQEQIRKLLIDSAHDFLSDINSDSALCFYLKNYYLTIKDIGITLFLIDSSGRGLNDPNIGIAKISKGSLSYITLVTNDIRSIKSECEETYDAALNELNK